MSLFQKKKPQIPATQLYVPAAPPGTGGHDETVDVEWFRNTDIFGVDDYNDAVDNRLFEYLRGVGADGQPRCAAYDEDLSGAIQAMSKPPYSQLPDADRIDLVLRPIIARLDRDRWTVNGGLREGLGNVATALPPWERTRSLLARAILLIYQQRSQTNDERLAA